jgi:predicted CXXCH cytochrome family protein
VNRVAPVACSLVLAVLGCPLRAQESRTGNGCASCHAAQQVEHLGSVHGRGAATCVDCHGGNAAARTEKEAHGDHYLGRIGRAAIPRLCAECHADVRRMTPFGLATDQFKAYSSSRHGIAVLHHKNESAAVCTDCHGVHQIRRADDPESTVHPARQAATCDRCHACADQMTAAHLKADTGKEFTAGAHGKAVAAGNAAAPSCTTCHGSHGAMAPGVTSVADVCGRCHEAEKAAFRASPHGGRNVGSPKIRCVDCHGAHDAETVGGGDVTTACAQCHKPDTGEWAAGARVRETLQRVEKTGAQALAQLAKASLDHAVAERAARLRDEAIPGIAKARAAAHSLDVDGMRRIADRLDVIEAESRDLAASREETLAGRRLFAVPVAILAGALIAGLLMVRQLSIVARRKRRAAGETVP